MPGHNQNAREQKLDWKRITESMCEETPESEGTSQVTRRPRNNRKTFHLKVKGH